MLRTGRRTVKSKTMKPYDGNTAAAHIGYALSDTALIYPITPSTPMGELADEWSAKSRKNAFGQVVDITEMQAEGGAAGAVHGALAVGSLATTFTASQGLLLMYPNMYKIAGELLPTVFHVAARAVAGQALSIFGDHSDVMGVRQSGFALLASSTIQECMDLALVAHLSTVKSRVPFIHFFEGFRLSHEINTVEPIPYSEISEMIDYEEVEKIRKRGLNPETPNLRGTSQDPNVYFQLVERQNKYYERVPDIVQEQMDRVGERFGRHYHLFEYHGAKDAERVIVIMGSGSKPCEELCDLYGDKEKIGVVNVRLYRPFDVDRFVAALPKTVKKIAVLDRTKEPGATGEPLYLDVQSALMQKGMNDIVVVGGRYGLGSAEFNPAHAKAVYDNLLLDKPKHGFTVGITDDVTFKSLEVGPEINTIPESTVQCQFWGLGSDGTVGANKEAIKLIVENTELYGQGYFAYSAHKSGGLSVSHLRFGPTEINSPYLITNTDYTACHCTPYIHKFDMLEAAKPNSVFVLNSPWHTLEEFEREIPNKLKKQIAEKNLRFYTIDASKIAMESGIPGKINMIMQAAFFKISEVIPIEKAMELLKGSIKHKFAKYGDDIIEKNINALENSIQNIQEVKYPKDKWARVTVEEEVIDESLPEFIRNVLIPHSKLKGRSLPVSVFPESGFLPAGVSQYEKRGVASMVAKWVRPDDCIQCNICSTVCPHATIRPFLFEHPDETSMVTIPSDDIEGFGFRIQVSPLDCVGCGLCVEECPGQCLDLVPVEKEEISNWETCVKLPSQGHRFDRWTIRGSQFQKPLLEFSGACGGCGETPYVKLVTQMVGEYMTIANATGCSSIWGGSYPVNPYTVNDEGRGPAWGNSLFEDNAEYGLGMAKGVKAQRNLLRIKVEEALEKGEVSRDSELGKALIEWLDEDVFNSLEKSKKVADRIKELLKKESGLEVLKSKADLFTARSMWIIGGDGWAYDIGFGGLDHVLASGENVNVLVLDTEVYSNTGGQASKSTPRSGVAKFTYSGKTTKKKDLAAIAMTYGNVYVGTVSTSSLKHLAKTLKEAIEWNGPSLIIAYAHCIAHGIKGGLRKGIQIQKEGEKTGYIPLINYNPKRALEGKNPFTIKSKKPNKKLDQFLDKQARYASLKKSYPDQAKVKQAQLAEDIIDRYEFYKSIADRKY